MSSKSETKRHRINDVTITKIVDIDNPAENIDETVTTTTSWNDTESNTGADRPNWKSIIAARGDAMNTVTASRARFTTVNPSAASVFIQRKRLQGNPPGRIVYRSEEIQYRSKLIAFNKPSPGTHLADATSNATRAFVRKARSSLSPANLGVTFGELNQTLGMLARPGRSLVRGFSAYLGQANKSLARNKRASKAKKKEILADTWLEYSFGWVPLISDAEDIAKAAAQMATGLPGIYVSKSARSETMQVASSGSQSFPSAGELRYDILNKTTTTCSVYGMIRSDLAAPGNFPQRFGLQLNNFLPTVWELVPWSFAIDYFTGVGDYISSMCFPLSSLQYYGRSRRTTVQRKSANYQIVGDTKTSSTNLEIVTSFSPGQTVAEVDSFTRDVPALLISPIRFSLPAAKTAYANLGALLTLRLTNQRRS